MINNPLVPQYLHLPMVPSTNGWVSESLGRGEALPEGLVVYTLRQTDGRGQVGNTWESEPDRNIAFTLLLRPVTVAPAHQFILSQMVALSVVEALRTLCPTLADTLSVKWPNDIYADHRKLGGILIENRLQGGVLAASVIGIGLNVQQEVWRGDAPNPTSLRLLGVDTTPEAVLQAVCQRILARYATLDSEGEALRRSYLSCLYRREGMHPYRDVATGENFEARIAAIDPDGPLCLELADGTQRRYWFKEVRFVLPCGVVKE